MARWKIAAASARAAVPDGSRRPSALPFMTPVPTAQAMAVRAQPEMLPLSAQSSRHALSAFGALPLRYPA